jgi:broad specificity phosphatase PhoE
MTPEHNPGSPIRTIRELLGRTYSERIVKSTKFLLIRHAESTWNAAGRWQGHGDAPLSELGLEQAARCGDRMRGEQADRLICSDLLRTRQTAEAIGRVLGLTPEPSEVLRELEIGRWTGLTRTAIEAAEPDLLAAFDSGDPDVHPGDGESRSEIRLRVRAHVESLAREAPGARLILVVHAGVIKALVPDANPANTEGIEVTLDDIRLARPDTVPELDSTV